MSCTHRGTVCSRLFVYDPLCSLSTYKWHPHILWTPQFITQHNTASFRYFHCSFCSDYFKISLFKESLVRAGNVWAHTLCADRVAPSPIQSCNLSECLWWGRLKSWIWSWLRCYTDIVSYQNMRPHAVWFCLVMLWYSSDVVLWVFWLRYCWVACFFKQHLTSSCTDITSTQLLIPF